MIQNCPKCNSFNVVFTTGGIYCNDCNYPNNSTIIKNTKKISKINNETYFIDKVIPAEYKNLANKINEIIDFLNTK